MGVDDLQHPDELKTSYDPDGGRTTAVPSFTGNSIQCFGDPGWSRTNGRQLRRLLLYPAELRDRIASAKVQRALRIDQFRLTATVPLLPMISPWYTGGISFLPTHVSTFTVPLPPVRGVA